MDDLGGGYTPRNHLVQRFRATTEPPADHRPTLPLRPSSYQRSSQSNLHRQSHTAADLESETVALKNLLSINTPTPSKSPAGPYVNGDGPPSPSPVHHSRTRSAAHSYLQRSDPSNSPTSRRVVSTSGAPPFPPDPQYPPSNRHSSAPSIDHEDQAAKAENALRKVLNLA